MPELYQGKLDTKPSCPHCSKTLDGFTCIGDEYTPPEEGCVTVCVYCQSVLEMDANKEFIFVTMETLEEIDFPTLQQAHRIVADLKLWEK